MRNEYPLVLPGGARVVHAAVDLRGPVPLLVRGVLVVLLDAAVLGALWLLAELVSGASSAPAAVAKPVALLPHPARGHAGRFLHRPGGRLRGVELRSPGRGGPAEPGSAHHPDAPGRGASRRADRCAVADDALEERLRELSRRIDADLGALRGRAARRTEHAGAGGSRRHAGSSWIPEPSSRSPSKGSSSSPGRVRSASRPNGSATA